MAQFGGVGGAFGGIGVGIATPSAIVVGSAASTDRTAEFLRLAAAAKAAQNPSSVPDTGASLGSGPSPSTITSASGGGIGVGVGGIGIGGPTPLAAASSSASAQSDFARRAAAVGAGIHATSERLRALAALARRTSSFDDPAAEIADLSARIKRDIAGLNAALSELAAVGARSRAGAGGGGGGGGAAGTSSAAQQRHSATVVDGLRLRLRDAASQFKDVLDARQRSLAAHADRRARFSSSVGAGPSGAGGGATTTGATTAAAPGPFGARGGFASTSSSSSSAAVAPRHQPLFAPRPPPRPPGGTGAAANSNGPASAAFAGAGAATTATTTATEAEKYVRNFSPSPSPSAAAAAAAAAASAAPRPAPPPPLPAAEAPMLRQRGGMARYGGGSGGGLGGGAAAASQPLLHHGQQLHHHSHHHQQQQQMQMLPPQDSYLASRAGALQQVESTIAELGGVFQQLATLVAEQGDMAIRIDEHVDEALGNVEGARAQLMRHLASISSDRWLVMKCLGVLLAFALFFIFVVA